MIDGVGQQVAQNPFHAAGIDLRDDRLLGEVDNKLGPGFVGEVAHGLQCPVDRDGHRHVLSRELGHPRVMAGDLEELVEERLEPVELLVEEFDRRLRTGSRSSRPS